ncbi:DNA polymerase processivity subunit [Ateline alphaherpesvirus 1]|uniref:DNA polymerase processivity factor n=1 Tax=Herpesvirus ateles type 1 (strain Lennette) TaxID=35243 RepID=A0A1S6JLM1_HSVA1|nr:DNA polymerase processivity subunit [Ateline alphaherpesvirus 1]AQS79173.1 DNA polymerase processivity subunit [Ateline alphaherpesvirus 1]
MDDADGRNAAPEAASPPPAQECRIVLRGAALNEMLQTFAPLRTTLLDSLLIFSERGLMVHGTVFGTPLYMPVGAERFGRYRWAGPPAAFLSLVDQKRSLLNVLRGNQHADLRCVEFAVSGTSPFRTLTQRIWTAGAEGADAEAASETLMKRELASFAVMVPRDAPDVQLRLSKAQLASVANVISGDGGSPDRITTFELGANGKFSVYNAGGCVTFVARESRGSGSPARGGDQANVLAAALKKSGHTAAGAKTVYGDNVHRTFTAALRSGDNVRAVLRRLQVRGAALKFGLLAEIPTLCITAEGPCAVSAFFFLEPRSLAEGGEGGAWDGDGRGRPAAPAEGPSPPPSKRARAAAADADAATAFFYGPHL